jgi:transcriptional regulator with XRE-family HTH domain
MVGENLRKARKAAGMSMQQLAGHVGVSTATLSRIETNKQALDMALFLQLAKFLRCDPSHLLGTEADANGNGVDPVIWRIAHMDSGERSQLWRALASVTAERIDRRRSQHDLAEEIEELLAQIDYLKSEVLAVRKRIAM